ncbi:MAG: hypothetical protein ABSC65_06395 [Acidobacteriaceae bacterium]|jgi:hypothetical protein
MNASAWPLLELSTRLLDPEEREVVLGDLLETQATTWRGLLDVFGLVLRRQAGLWRDPRPWVAAFVVALPSSYLLMAASFSVTCTYQRLVNHRVFVGHWPTGHEGFPLLLCHMLLLVAWSWTAGYMIGSVSRRTLWASVVLAAVPSLDSLCTPVSGLCLFLFLPPAILGIWRGWQGSRLSFRAASVLALTVTVLMISAWTRDALWTANWALLCPAWYLVVGARRARPNGGDGIWPMRHARVL